MSILKRFAAQPLGLRWGFETASSGKQFNTTYGRLTIIPINTWFFVSKGIYFPMKTQFKLLIWPFASFLFLFLFISSCFAVRSYKGIHLDKIKMPHGFKIDVYISDFHTVMPARFRILNTGTDGIVMNLTRRPCISDRMLRLWA